MGQMDGEEIVVGVRENGAGGESYRSLRLITRRGEVACRYYPSADTLTAMVCVGGAGGGWDTPAQDLYPRLCEALAREGTASLRVRFRNPHDLAEAVHDVEAGLAYLRTRGAARFALLGHSFGGAVVIQAAAKTPAVRTVVTLATQSHGAHPVEMLAPRCSVLLLHGLNDRVLPPSASEFLYALAGHPKDLRLYPGAGHVLDEAAAEIYQTVHQWLAQQLGSPVEGSV